MCIPDELERKMMARVTKSVKENKGNLRGIEHPTLFADHLLYEVSFPNGRTEELKFYVIDKKTISQVDSEGFHYQVQKKR